MPLEILMEFNVSRLNGLTVTLKLLVALKLGVPCSVTCTLTAKASAEGRLFGSVSRQEIREALVKEGLTVDRRAIELNEPLKQVGLATIPVHLGNGVTAQLKVNVVAEV